MGRQLQLLSQGGKTSLSSPSPPTMKIFSLLLCVGLSASAVVKRDADADAKPDAVADADADASGYHGYGYGHAPECTLTPVKECVPRQVENPRKVCQTVVDVHEDTVVREDCEEVITTTCTQTSQTAQQSSAVVDTSSKLVEEGVPKVIEHAPVAYHAPVAVAHHAPAVAVHSYGKRSADADAVADADADASYGYGAHAVVTHPVKSASAPVCSSTPVKTCKKIPLSSPRRVARIVCDTVVDVTTIEDCTETVTKVCSQTHTSHSRHSAVVGKETKVVATGVAHTAGYH